MFPGLWLCPEKRGYLQEKMSADSTSAQHNSTDGTQHQPLRMCTACRQFRPREQLVRLTVDWRSGEVLLNVARLVQRPIQGRSTYLCPLPACIEQALKGNKLRSALQGGRGKKLGTALRAIKWPLEPQLINTLRTMCTESSESCHNTLKGGTR